MMIDESYEKLGIKDKENFTRVVNRLLRVNYINRDVYVSRDKEMRSNTSYRFIERNYALFEEYLSLGGWDLHKDDRFGVIHVTSHYDYNRKRINKFTTQVLLTLRLIYDEEREKLTLKKEVSLTVHELVQKMIVLGIIEKKPALKLLHEALSELAGFRIIERLAGQWQDPETRFLIYPSILFILSNAKINELVELTEAGDEDDAEPEIMIAEEDDHETV